MSRVLNGLGSFLTRTEICNFFFNPTRIRDESDWLAGYNPF